MIFDGRNGYVSGNLDQANDTVLAMIKGPNAGENWFDLANSPEYEITISAGAAGTVKLQGTNDVDYRGDGAEMDFLPTDNATWTDIQTATNTTASGTVGTSYEFLRLIIGTQGAGYVLTAWVRWH